MPALTKVQTGFIEPQGAFPIDTGTAAAPGLKFSDSAATGIFSPSTGIIGFSTSGLQQALTIHSDGQLISSNGTLRRNVSDSSFTVSGDTASNAGANINLYGASHSTLANVFRVRIGSTERLRVGSTGKLEVYKGTSTTGKTSGSEAFTVGNGAGNHRFAVYPDGTTVIGGTGDIGNYNILLQNDGQAVFNSNIQIADSIFHVGDLNTRIRFPGNDTFSIEIDGDERLHISSDGNVGVGDDNPDVPFNVKAGGASFAGQTTHV